MDLIEIYVEESLNERLDYYISKELKEISRTYISKLIKDGFIIVNGKKMKPRYIVQKGDLIRINIPKSEAVEILPENIPLDIVYEDGDILVINKPKGMVVHPAPGNTTGTLVNALLYNIKDLSSINDSVRPGIVHRLDKDTSGVLIIAKNDESHQNLINQFKTRKIKRVYTALVYGKFNTKEATINAPIGRHPVNRKRMAVVHKNSKEAITKYKILREFGDYSLVELNLQTGRTHQIRVHMAYLGHPIVGDLLYSNRKNEFNITSQLLHARKIGFSHPKDGVYIELAAPLPKEFKDIIQLLEKRNR